MINQNEIEEVFINYRDELTKLSLSTPVNKTDKLLEIYTKLESSIEIEKLLSSKIENNNDEMAEEQENKK